MRISKHTIVGVNDLLDAYKNLILNYEDAFEEKDAALKSVYRYLVYLVRSVRNGKEVDSFIKSSIGKFTDEIDIPATDVE